MAATILPEVLVGCIKKSNQMIGNCWKASVETFRSRLLQNPSTDTLFFVSLLVPAADTGTICEHFAVEDGGFIIDPTMVLVGDEPPTLECSMYYKCMQDSATQLGIHSYNCEPLRLTPKQFSLFMDIVPLCARVKPEDWSLATIRKCVVALLQEWDVTKTDEMLAELVIFRVHGIQIRLSPK